MMSGSQKSPKERSKAQEKLEKARQAASAQPRRASNPILQPGEVQGVQQGLQGTQFDQLITALTEIKTQLDVNSAGVKALDDSVKAVINRLDGIDASVKANTEAISKVQKDSQLATKEVKECKEQVKAAADRITELEQQRIYLQRQEQATQISVAFLQMQARENHLILRKYPEVDKGELSLKDQVIEDFTNQWKLDREELQKTIQKVYRLRPRGQKGAKILGDCVVEFQTRAQRDEILSWHFKEKLKIKGEQVILFKFIPKLFLTFRNQYQDLASALNKKITINLP
ncbi:uncharacterized protein LOC132592423 [Zootoca vivipara]|uniref:uncharacterized protein LOC132592423 n=1 Tax=Zootoca vivipara TaxID=8524 RepID=UPI00293BE46B|nr:uncharacterized protein LOC132592423 [Zootoca vivipara]